MRVARAMTMVMRVPGDEEAIGRLCLGVGGVNIGAGVGVSGGCGCRCDVGGDGNGGIAVCGGF